MLERGVQGLLYAFFAQRMMSDPPNGFTTPSWVKQIQTPGGSIRCVVPLDDEESTIFEPVMTELRMSDRASYELLKRSWGDGWSDMQIARNYVPARSKGMSRDDVTAWRVRLEAQIEARIGTV